MSFDTSNLGHNNDLRYPEYTLFVENYRGAHNQQEIPCSSAPAAYGHFNNPQANYPAQGGLYPTLDDLQPNAPYYSAEASRPAEKHSPSKPQSPSLAERSVKLVANVAKRLSSLALGVADVAIGTLTLSASLLVAAVTSVSWAISANALIVMPPIGILMAIGTAGMFYTEIKLISFAFGWFKAGASNLGNAFSC